MQQLLPSHPRSSALLAMAVLLCLLLLLNFTSSGVIRPVGDDEDSGSGIGGTGRLLVPGSESGLGGTGVRPFLGYAPGAATDRPAEVAILLNPGPDTKPLSADVSIPADASLPALDKPLPRSIEVMAQRQLTRDSGAIHIAEAVQRDIDSNALLTYRVSPDTTANAVDLDEGRSEASRDSAVSVAENASKNALPQHADSAAPDTGTSITWSRLANSLTPQNQTAGTLLAADNNDSKDVDDGDKVARPDTMQRPVLPPLQRVRPIQRAGLLPPPVRPLRL